jgi:putative ABC transport system ATP-binding protein
VVGDVRADVREEENGRARVRAIQTDGLRRYFDSDDGPIKAVDGVTLEVDEGDFVSVMGPSGCGKSTLLHLLGGLDRASAGEIALFGERVEALQESQWARLRRQRIGFVFQALNLLDDLTVGDNLVLAGVLGGMSAKHARRRAADLLTKLGVGDKFSSSPSKLSGGQQQRVAIARALVHRPALLLADEPTGSLDSSSTGDVIEQLRLVHEQGTTVVLVTHDARVATAADRLLSMRDGQIVDETRLTGGTRASFADVLERR